MSLMGDLKRARQNNVLDALKKRPMTTEEVAEMSGASYHTARNDLRELTAGGYASPTGGMRNGASLFQAGHSRPMPMLYFKSNNQSHPVTALGDSYARNPGKTASAQAALDIPQIAAELMYLLALSVTEAHPNHSPLKTRAAHIIQLRGRLANAMLHMETITDIAQQMLNDDRLWDVKSLEEIAADPLFNAEKSILAHETIISLKE